MTSTIDYEKNASNAKTRSQQATNMTTSTKKTIFLENKPKIKNKTPEIKERFFYSHAT